MRAGLRTRLRAASGALTLAFALSLGFDAAGTTLDARAAAIDLVDAGASLVLVWPGGAPDFRAAMAATSWNTLASFASLRDPTLPPPLVALNADPLDGGCSFANPAGCSRFASLYDVRAGGSGRFGRRDLGPFLPRVRVVPIDPNTVNERLSALVCGTSIGFGGRDGDLCQSRGQGGLPPAVPEPTAALLFAAGVGVAALGVRRR